MNSIIKFFSSVRLAIVLLIIITVASILGTLIPQGRAAAEYGAHYGRLAEVLIRLEITTLYHSWWFLGLLFMFSLNILVCTLTRLSQKFKKALNPSIDFQFKKIVSMKMNDQWEMTGVAGEIKGNFLSILSSKRYNVKESHKNNLFCFLAQKKRLGLFGSDIVHLGLLIILAGGIISGFTGFREKLTMREGEVLKVPKKEFSLQLDKFETEYYENRQVKDWKSTLSVLENGEKVYTKIIEVNHPLSYKGAVFYQAFHGWDWDKPKVKIQMTRKDDNSFLKEIDIKIGEKISLPDLDQEIQALHFVPDFILDENNQVASRSMEPRNPAILVKITKQEEEVFSGWLFANFPDFSRIHSQKETDLVVRFKSYEAGRYSGIEMAIDPGVNLIWLGCVILMFGFLVAFYWPPSEIRMVVEEKGNKTKVGIGGRAPKRQESFKTEFEKIAQRLRS